MWRRDPPTVLPPSARRAQGSLTCEKGLSTTRVSWSQRPSITEDANIAGNPVQGTPDPSVLCVKLHVEIKRFFKSKLLQQFTPLTVLV